MYDVRCKMSLDRCVETRTEAEGYLLTWSALIIKDHMERFVATMIFLAALTLVGCEPAATFDKPQPDKVKSLASFPQRLQGKYLSVDQASVVTITDKQITRHYDFDFKVHKDSIGSSYKLIGDTLTDQAAGTQEKVVLKGDTIIQQAKWTDTLFIISPDHVLKKFKGYYFLNSRYSESAWEVKELSLKKGVLIIGVISTEEDLQKLKEITESNADTLPTHFTLTRQQFKTFVKQEGFGEKERFNRITGKVR